MSPLSAAIIVLLVVSLFIPWTVILAVILCAAAAGVSWTAYWGNQAGSLRSGQAAISELAAIRAKPDLARVAHLPTHVREAFRLAYVGELEPELIVHYAKYYSDFREFLDFGDGENNDPKPGWGDPDPSHRQIPKGGRGEYPFA